MFNFWTVIYLIIVGLVAGYVARLLIKGANPMTWWQTMLLGIVTRHGDSGSCGP